MVGSVETNSTQGASRKVGAAVDARELQCFILGLTDGDDSPIELAPIQTLVEDRTPDENFYEAVDTHTNISVVVTMAR
jgi:hypothetical protein